MVYLAIILLLIVLVYVYDYRRAVRGRIFWLIAIGVIFSLVGGLHYRIGLDYSAYDFFYDHLAPINEIRSRDFEASRYAPGFIILASIAKVFYPEVVLLHLFQASFVCGVVTWFFKNNTRNPFFALLLFFFFLFTLLLFEQIREAIAVGFFLLAWPYFKNKNWLMWYLLSLCAMMFHTSATMMLALPVLYLPGIRNLFVFGKTTFIAGAVVFVGAFIIQASFFNYIQLLALTESSRQLVNMYEGTHYLKGSLNVMGIVFQLFRTILYPILAMYFLSRYRQDYINTADLEKKEIFVILSIYISLFTISVPIISRFNNYFYFFAIILMSDWLFDYIKIHNKIFRFRFEYWVVLFIPLFAIQIYSSYFNSINKSGTLKSYMIYYPYTSFIEKSIDENKEKAITYVRRHDQ